MAAGNTMLAQMLDPQVLQDMLFGKIENAIRFTPFAKIDTTLVGQPGSKVTVPVWDYIGKAEVTGELQQVIYTQMGYTDAEYTIKKYTKGVLLSDEAVLSGFGNPVGQANYQLGLSIADAIEADCVTALGTATQQFAGTGLINHLNVVKAIDVFEEEVMNNKVIFVHPKQLSQLRVDSQFISATEAGYQTMITGEIGMIAGVRIIASRRVEDDGTNYLNPILLLTANMETEDDIPALTIYLKRDVMLETSRDVDIQGTKIVVNKHGMPALTNQTRVVVLKSAMTATTAKNAEPPKTDPPKIEV